jgi:hypothetical protein
LVENVFLSILFNLVIGRKKNSCLVYGMITDKESPKKKCQISLHITLVYIFSAIWIQLGKTPSRHLEQHENINNALSKCKAYLKNKMKPRKI